MRRIRCIFPLWNPIEGRARDGRVFGFAFRNFHTQAALISGSLKLFETFADYTCLHSMSVNGGRTLDEKILPCRKMEKGVPIIENSPGENRTAINFREHRIT